MKQNFDLERLNKIVRLAKEGQGGEKANALHIVKNLCKKYELDFEEVMQGKDVREFTIKFRTTEEEDLLTQIIIRYAFMEFEDKLFVNKLRKVLIFSTTPQKYFETLAAFDILRSALLKEKKKIKAATFRAFISKHELFYAPKSAEDEEKFRKAREEHGVSERDESVEEMARGIARNMDDVAIHKRLNAKT